jgi:hypothetical protein
MRTQSVYQLLTTLIKGKYTNGGYVDYILHQRVSCFRTLVVESLKQAAVGKFTKINLRTSNGDSVTFEIKQHCDRKPQFF